MATVEELSTYINKFSKLYCSTKDEQRKYFIKSIINNLSNRIQNPETLPSEIELLCDFSRVTINSILNNGRELCY